MLESISFADQVHSGQAPRDSVHWTAAQQTNYEKWRDSFGVADMSDVWSSQRNFGGEIRVESICKNMLALEAVTVPGTGSAAYEILSDSKDIQAAVDDMLDSMFGVEGNLRTGSVDECPVDIRPRVRLAGVPIDTRISAITAPMGRDAALKYMAQ